MPLAASGAERCSFFPFTLQYEESSRTPRRHSVAVEVIAGALFILCAWFMITPAATAQVWQLTESGSMERLNNIFFADSMHGWAVGNNSTILATSNGGLIWQRQTLTDSARTLQSVVFIDSLVGWVVGTSVIVHTTDGGTSWVSEEFNSMLYDVSFSNRKKGYIVGGFNNTITILVTTDGGSTWDQSYNSAHTGRIYAAYLKDDSTAIMTGYDSWDNFGNDIEYYIHENSSTVDKISLPSLGGLHDIDFNDPMNGFAVGAWKSFVLITTDAGVSWYESVPVSSTTWFLFSVNCIGDSTVWVAGLQEGKGIIAHSNNLGNSFIIDSVQSTSSVYSIFMLSQQIGWACGDHGTIWKYHPVTTAGDHTPPTQPDDVHITVTDAAGGMLRLLVETTTTLQGSICIYDGIGRVAAMLSERRFDAGRSVVTLDLQRNASGIYHAVFVTEGRAYHRMFSYIR
jgi:photosystem II stability/assembly factor-like uncharacterized protein